MNYLTTLTLADVAPSPSSSLTWLPIVLGVAAVVVLGVVILLVLRRMAKAQEAVKSREAAVATAAPGSAGASGGADEPPAVTESGDDPGDGRPDG
jgi:hypothetical protein